MKKQQVYKTVQQLFASLLNHAPYMCAKKPASAGANF
jgi:hypothetical protein